MTRQEDVTQSLTFANRHYFSQTISPSELKQTHHGGWRTVLELVLLTKLSFPMVSAPHDRQKQQNRSSAMWGTPVANDSAESVKKFMSN